MAESTPAAASTPTVTTPPAAASAAEVTSSSGYASMSRDLDNIDTSDAPEEVAPVEAARAEAQSAEPPEMEEPPAEEVEESAAAPLEEKPAEAKAEDELPEGVSVRDRNGKKEFVLRENRYRAFHDAYSTQREVENIFGEPLTPALAEARQQAYLNFDAMLGDFVSGDPGLENRFLGALANWSRQAREDGEVEHNPLQSLVAKLPEFLSRSGESEALKTLAAPVLRSTFDSLYPAAYQAHAQGNENLRKALQWVDYHLTGSYKTIDQMAAMLPEADTQRAQQLEQREQKINQREQAHQAAEYEGWRRETSAAVVAAVKEELVTALKPVEAAYKNFPREYDGLVKVLDANIQDALKRDASWQRLLERSTLRARNATPAVRNAVAEDLLARYRAKARWVLDPTRNKDVEEILRQRAGAIQAQSDRQHERLERGAARREPGAVGTPVPQTIRDHPAAPNGKLSGRAAWEAAVDAALR